MLSSAQRHRLRLIIPAYPAFNIYSGLADKTTTLGAVTIATAVNKMEGWDAEVIDENNLRRYGPREGRRGADHHFLQRQRPADVIGFYGGLTSTIPRLYALARFYKQQNGDVITMAGGQHFVAETLAEALDSHIDYLVLGEGEETVKELLPALAAHQDISSIKGIAYRQGAEIVVTQKRGPICDFDKLPLPDFSLVRYAKIKVYPVERIRGCGMNCEFCTVKGRPRCAAVGRLLGQISNIVETQDARHFFIVDDLFGQQRDETIQFCYMLRDYQRSIGRRLDFTAQIRLDKARDSELLSAMREAGINMVAIGYESPIKEELNAMHKKVNPDEMIGLTNLFHKHGFLVHGMFIFGYPMQRGVIFRMTTQQRLKRYRQFINKARIDTLQVLLPVPLPGTELRDRLKREARLYPLSEVGWEYYDGNFPLFEPDEGLSAEEMLKAVQQLMGGFYQFKYMFKVALNIFSFAAMIFYLHNIRRGWRRWYRPWRNDLIRFGGWFIVKNWAKAYKKESFPEKLARARTHLRSQ